MSGTRLLATVTILSVISFPAVAQQVISEPGYCAFFYPNANCQNKGPGNPFTGDAWLRLNQGEPMPASPQRDHASRKRAHRSLSSLR